MSDGKVRAAIEQMEAWIADPNWEPDPDVLAQWSEAFQEAMIQADRAAGWTDLMARAHAAGEQLEDRAEHFARIRDGVKAELDGIGCGHRALRGYGASAR